MAAKSLWVRSERIRLLHRQIPPALAANIIIGGLVVGALWQLVDWRLLVGWGAVLAPVIAIRLGVWVAYSKSRTDAQVAASSWHYAAGSAITGILWGSTAFLFVDFGEPLSLLLIAFVIGGMGAGAVATNSSHLPTLYAYLLTSVPPLAARLALDGSGTALAMSAMVIVYLALLAAIACRFHATLMRNLFLTEQRELLMAQMERKVCDRTRELRLVNRRLIEARREAERANEAKSRFLAAASHDLRQPMQSLFLFAATLRQRLAGRPETEVLTMLERGLDTLKDLLDSLLDISRLEVNLVRPQIAPVPLRPLIEEVTGAYRQVAAAKGIDLRLDGDCDFAVRTDANLLGRMVRNLMDNAVRYTAEGQILVTCQVVGVTARLAVRDTGIGIAPDQIERIFDEFHQVGNVERDKAQGLGLGLAIVKRLSSALGHGVSVESTPGRGSIFVIELPLAVVAEPQG